MARHSAAAPTGLESPPALFAWRAPPLSGGFTVFVRSDTGESRLYQEARGVVQQTSEAADEAPVREGGVFTRGPVGIAAQLGRGGGAPPVSVWGQEVSKEETGHKQTSNRRYSAHVCVCAEPHLMKHDMCVFVCF